jgi:hypothetical protein
VGMYIHNQGFDYQTNSIVIAQELLISSAKR